MFELVEFCARMIGYVGIAFIAFGSFVALCQYFISLVGRRSDLRVRLTLGNHLLLGLEFLVGKDIIETVLDTNMEHLKGLALIVIIRIVLEHFVGREMKHLMRDLEVPSGAHAASASGTSRAAPEEPAHAPAVAIARHG